MINEIKSVDMPKWGMEMSEGEINLWHIEIGDQVNVEDDLVDVETSKIVNTVTASDSGILRAIVAHPGETHRVGSILAVLASADTSDEDIQAFIASHKVVETSEVATAELTTPEATAIDAITTASPPQSSSSNAKKLAEGEDDRHVSASPVARRLAVDYGVNLNNITGTGRHGRVSKRDLEAAVTAFGGRLLDTNSAAPSEIRYGDDSNVKATPVARRIAEQLGINLLECRVSGDRGRVCKADVEAAVALKNRLPAQSTGSVDAVLAVSSESHAISGVRKSIAMRLQSSKQTAPHYRVQIDVELDNLLAVRKQVNSDNSEAKISVNDFIVKACASALIKIPALNVQFDGEQITYFNDANISVAVAINDGLITPIVTQANRKGLIAISNEIRDLATRAKLNRLKPDEFQGGSFCISNLGMYGIKQFDAIINPPQGAILAVGAGEPRSVVKNGELSIATVMSLTLSSDHRIIDGAIAAQFMSVLKGYLEQPAPMLV